MKNELRTTRRNSLVAVLGAIGIGASDLPAEAYTESIEPKIETASAAPLSLADMNYSGEAVSLPVGSDALATVAAEREVVSSAGPASAWYPSVVLENQLGNTSQLTNSDIGPNGTVEQGDAPIVFGPVKFGNGVQVDWSNGGTINTSLLFNISKIRSLSRRGTLSFWVKPNHDSNYNDIAYWVTSEELSLAFSSLAIYWRGWDQVIRFELCEPSGCLPNAQVDVPNSRFEFRANDVFHVALIWNRAGIANTTDRLRAYINGRLMGSAPGWPWPTTVRVPPILLGRPEFPQLAYVDELTVNRKDITDWSTLPVK